MLITVGLVLLGIATTVAIDRQLGGRTVGRAFVPILAVAALYRWYVLPVFLLATAATSLLLPAVERRTLVSGRRAALVAVGLGAVVSLAVLVPLDRLGASMEPLAIAGSLVPGAAAYRLRRLSAEARRRVLVSGTGSISVVGLLGGIAAVAFVTPPCVTCGVIPWNRLSATNWFLLSPSADLLLVASGVPPAGQTGHPSLVAILGIVVAGAVLATGVQLRWGLGLLGPVGLPLLALAVLQSGWALAVYLLSAVLSFLVVEVVRLRVSVADGYEAAAVGTALVATLGLSVALALPGPTAFVVGAIAGYGGHRLHTIAPPDRQSAIAVAAGLLSGLVAVAWAALGFRGGELADGGTVLYIAVGVLAMAVAAAVLYRHERGLPSRKSVAADSVVQEGL